MCSCSLSGPRFEEFLDRLENDDLILIEATTLSFWFVEQVAKRMAAWHAMNTHKLAKQGNNTDKIDALRLVNILAYNDLGCCLVEFGQIRPGFPVNIKDHNIKTYSRGDQSEPARKALGEQTNRTFQD